MVTRLIRFCCENDLIAAQLKSFVEPQAKPAGEITGSSEGN